MTSTASSLGALNAGKAIGMTVLSEGVLRRPQVYAPASRREVELLAPAIAIGEVDAGNQAHSSKALYGSPPGVISPSGGEALGHRGALGLLVEAMATLVPGEDTADSSRVGDNQAFVVIRVDEGSS